MNSSVALSRPPSVGSSFNFRPVIFHPWSLIPHILLLEIIAYCFNLYYFIFLLFLRHSFNAVSKNLSKIQYTHLIIIITAVATCSHSAVVLSRINRINFNTTVTSMAWICILHHMQLFPRSVLGTYSPNSYRSSLHSCTDNPRGHFWEEDSLQKCIYSMDSFAGERHSELLDIS